MLYRMYTRWVERHGFKLKLLDMLDGEEAGTPPLLNHPVLPQLQFSSSHILLLLQQYLQNYSSCPCPLPFICLGFMYSL